MAEAGSSSRATLRSLSPPYAAAAAVMPCWLVLVLVLVLVPVLGGGLAGWGGEIAAGLKLELADLQDGRTDDAIRWINAIDAAISMRKPSRASWWNRNALDMQGGDPSRERTNRVSWLVQVLPGLCFRGAGSVLAPGEKGHGGKATLRWRENEPRDAALSGATLYFV
ncbi:uncharacterized protein Triagg1_9782 [Trichoderma aggressivum f. europaeum]|uniref:Uncharacterized protein n=1 Tax=Trichoderma aggressivum f. europaeum TaxID=173218 RepID=A0AAE1IA25_9HYPO|nr:hypothetical protein Triagg1_9782 [Trichoderma aggressivum f. europaeum]